jgi:4-amino-4-deoxy-L-arabinose transferase-like glycosyltransferase
MLLNTVFSLLLLFLVYHMARRLLGELPALLALLAITFYPSQIYYAVSGIPTVLYTLLLMTVLWQAWRTKECPDRKQASLWGLCLGICALSYSFVVVVAPILGIWLILCSAPERRIQAIRSVSWSAAVAILICVPWTIRNYQAQGQFVLLRDQGGTNLWWGNGPRATGGVADMDGNTVGYFPGDLADTLSTMGEVEADRYLGSIAKREMREHPWRTFKLWIHKAKIFWWFDDSAHVPGGAVAKLMPVLKVLKLLLLVSAFAGLWILRRRKSLVLWILVPCFCLGTMHMVFHAGRIRYFFPLEPILILAAASAWSALLLRLGFPGAARLQRSSRG